MIDRYTEEDFSLAAALAMTDPLHPRGGRAAPATASKPGVDN